MSAPLPDGPFYRCQHPVQSVRPLGCTVMLLSHPPERLRYIKGAWRCYECFADGFGRDVLHEWDTATTLAEYLEGRHDN